MSEAHVQVLYEVRGILRDLQPTLKTLRGMQGVHLTAARRGSRRSRTEYVTTVARLIDMCEEVSELLYVGQRYSP